MAKNVTIVGNEHVWAAMQDTLHNSVVQVVGQIIKFNWREPYNPKKQYESYGSGFFIDNDGHILTNAHVVDGAVMVWIHIPQFGKRPVYVDIVGFCPDRDVALLKIRKTERAYIKEQMGSIKALELGDSDRTQRTDSVLVLGYPLGSYGVKGSTGIVSGRETYDEYSLLQVTAPINPGNSGGPMFDAEGKVIGIAASIITGTQNIGFALPINDVKIILDDLYTIGFVRRRALGMLFNYSTDQHALLFGNPLPAGIYINTVFPDSLFEEVGIKEGDMLYEFNGYRLDNFGDATVSWSTDKVSITDLVGRLKNNDDVPIVVYRNGKRLELSMVFALTKPYPVRKMYPQYEEVEYEAVGGMVIMQLAQNHFSVLSRDTPFIVEYAKPVKKAEPILVITHILGGSLAQQTRSLYPGGLIAEVNGKKVKTLDMLRKAIKLSEDSQVLTIKTTHHIFAVLDWDDVVRDEERLSLEYNYPLSKMMLRMIRKHA